MVIFNCPFSVKCKKFVFVNKSSKSQKLPESVSDITKIQRYLFVEDYVLFLFSVLGSFISAFFVNLVSFQSDSISTIVMNVWRV